MYEKIEVQWIDTTSSDGWTTPEEGVTFEPATIVTIGFRVYQDERRLVMTHGMQLCTEHEAPEVLMGVVVIPTATVLSVKSLEPCGCPAVAPPQQQLELFPLAKFDLLRCAADDDEEEN